MLSLGNNLKVSWRHLRKNWGSTLLNVTGLMLGVVCSVVIFLTVKYEFSFDQQHANAPEIYRVTNNYYYPTFTMHVGQTPDPMATALRTDFPDFKAVVPINSSYHHNLSVEDQIFETDILYCGPDFISLFDYYDDPAQWLIGNPKEILKEVNQTVLTESLATTLFGSSEEAIDKTVRLSSDTPLTVAGVMKDPPGNTNYPFNQLVSYATYENFMRNTFGGVSSTSTFVQVPANTSVEQLRPALGRFNEKYMEAAWGEDFVSMDLQPLSEIHFDERFGSNSYTTDRSYLWTLGFIGLFMILVACINFVNLATARAANRSKEIGMRKVLGGSKGDIMWQFLTESFVLATVSLGLGLAVAQTAFGVFSELTNLNIGNDFTYTPDLILFISGLLLFIALAMGMYPALVLAGFKPLEVIGQQRSALALKGLSLRRGLIAFQLTTAQVLVISAIVISSQLDFFQNKDLGFDEESILVVNFHGDIPEGSLGVFKQKVSELPFVQAASLNSSIPMSGHNSTTGLSSKDSEVQERFNVQYIYADNDYADAMNFEVLAGKTMVNELEQDTVRGFVVNETLVDRLAFGSPESAIGKQINVHGLDSRIIGVVQDFHTLSLHEEIRPVAMVYGVKDYSNLGIRYQTSDLSSALAQLEGSWKEVFPDKNFDYYFQNEQLGDMYESETRLSKLIKAFTIIAIIIACFGLIGLSAFASVRRFKEIGVRKILGATVPNILLLMSKEFVILTLVGFALSVPIAYFLVSAWLADFAYHVDLQWWMVAGAGLLTMILTVLTVGFHSVQAAMVSPVKSLRRD